MQCSNARAVREAALSYREDLLESRLCQAHSVVYYLLFAIYYLHSVVCINITIYFLCAVVVLIQNSGGFASLASHAAVQYKYSQWESPIP